MAGNRYRRSVAAIYGGVGSGGVLCLRVGSIAIMLARLPAPLRGLLTLLILNPIAVRLVQNGSTRLRHLYIRAGYLAVLIIVLMTLLMPGLGDGALNYRTLAQQGASAFEVSAYLQLFLICVLTPVFMAGAIAQESNPKTWDVLLTTPMSQAQIVLGHLFGRLFFVLALLFASLPLFAITQYFGGVPGSSVLASYAIGATSALLVGAIAIALAVNRVASRRAVFGFYVAVVSYLGVTFAADVFVQQGGPGGVNALTPLNPFLAMRALLEPSVYPVPDAIELGQMGSLARFWFGSPVLAWCTVSGSSALFLSLLSSLTVRSAGTGTAWYQRAFGVGGREGDTRQAREVWHNPIAWREAAARASTLPKRVLRWGFVALGGAFGVLLTLLYHVGTLDHDAFRIAILATIFTEFAVVTLVAINMAATAISREREDGTLDLLLTTPVTEKAYLNGKLRGLISYLLPLAAVPLGTVAVAGGYVAVGGFGRADGVTDGSFVGSVAVQVPVLAPEAALLLPVSALPFLGLCVMVGLSWSLRSKGTITSVVATVLAMLGIAATLSLCGWAAGGEIPYAGAVLAGLSPGPLLMALTDAPSALQATATSTSSAGAPRVWLAVGAVLSVPVYLLIVMAMRSAMVRTFDTTTRRLAGTK